MSQNKCTKTMQKKKENNVLKSWHWWSIMLVMTEKSFMLPSWDILISLLPCMDAWSSSSLIDGSDYVLDLGSVFKIFAN